MRSAGDQHATLPFEERGRKGCGTSRRTALPPSRDALNRRAASYDLPIQLFVLPDRSHSKAEPHSHRTDRAASGSQAPGPPTGSVHCVTTAAGAAAGRHDVCGQNQEVACRR